MYSSHKARAWVACLTGGLITVAAGSAPAQPPTTLKIGSTGSLAAGTSGGDEKGALDTLNKFIKSETGFDNSIVDRNGWRELAQRMEKGDDQIGVFQGFELAWAQEKYPKLQPLAVAVNARPYLHVYIVARKDSKAASIDDLKGKKMTVPRAGKGYPLLVLETLAKSPPNTYFADLKFSDSVEDALDDVVDGVIDATAVDRGALDSFKRRKPARFAQLKEVAQSKPIPATAIVYYDGKLDGATVAKFRDGLVNANKKEKGRNLLTYFKLTGFVPPPRDYETVLAQTRKDYPEPAK